MEPIDVADEPWAVLRRRFAAARAAFSPQIFQELSLPTQAEWRDFFTASDTCPLDETSAEFKTFFNRLSRKMILALPAPLHGEWHELWLLYSELMNATRMSIFDGLAEGKRDAWSKLTTRYDGFLRAQFFRWKYKGWLGSATVEDLLQQFYLQLFAKLPEFQRQRVGSFRAWMRRGAADVVRRVVSSDRLRDVESLTDALLNDHSEASRDWDREHRQHVFRQAIEELRKTTDAKHIDVFLALADNPADETVEQVAARFDITRANADKIKSRLLREVKLLLERWGER